MHASSHRRVGVSKMKIRKMKKLQKLIKEWCNESWTNEGGDCSDCPLQPFIHEHCAVDKLERCLNQEVNKK